MQHTHEELFGSDSDEAEAATPAVAQSPTASDARVDEILRYGARGRAACTAALGCSPTASEFELYEKDPEGFEEEENEEEEEDEE